MLQHSLVLKVLYYGITSLVATFAIYIVYIHSLSSVSPSVDLVFVPLLLSSGKASLPPIGISDTSGQQSGLGVFHAG